MLVKAGGQTWYLCHPKAYSSVPLTQRGSWWPSTAATSSRAHLHDAAVGYAADGVHVVAEIGGFQKREATAYLQRSTSYPIWQQGWGVIGTDGRLTLHSPGWSTA
jgi:hypothetical protein